MFNSTRATILLLSLGFASVLTATAAQADNIVNVIGVQTRIVPGTPAAYGSAVASSYAQRDITIGADTRYVNLDNGDTVRFNMNGKSFTWHVDTLINETSFNLSTIAPKDFKVDGVRVFVASNPLYRG